MSYPVLSHCLPPRTADKSVILCIGGSDSIAMAGIQMDSRCSASLGLHCVTAITAVTAQTNHALVSLNPVSSRALKQQVESGLSLHPKAIKIGLLASIEQVYLLADLLAHCSVPITLDPVLATSSKGNTATDFMITAMVEQLLPLCTLVTPNIPEAKRLLNLGDNDESDPWQLAQKLQALGVPWVVVKGGHETISSANQTHVHDYIAGPEQLFSLSQPRIKTHHNRGTGCALASSLSSLMALGYEVRDALIIGKMMMQAALEAAQGIDGQQGCVAPQGFPSRHWPEYADQCINKNLKPLTFPTCVGHGEPEQLGLYPIVDSTDWLERVLSQGVTTAQLRVKELQGTALQTEIGRAVAVAKRHQCRLFINDHWRQAIAAGAYGVHLGQEDLQAANLSAIAKSGLRLGISNHSHFELAKTLTIQPSYIACGPIFTTTTKVMPWIPYGMDGLDYWCKSLLGRPLVAIAGIDAGNIAAISATGVSGIALITCITKALNPEQMTRHLLQQIEANRT